MWRQCRGTGKNSEPGLTLPFFTPLSIKEESRTTAYQKDFIESQSMEDSSKNPEWSLAFREQPFLVLTAKAWVISAHSFPGIFSLGKQMRCSAPGGRHLPHQRDAGTPLQRNYWFFLSPWWERGKTKNPTGNTRRRTAGIPTAGACEAGLQDLSPGASEKPHKHRQGSNHRRSGLFFWDDSFPHATFIKYIKDQIKNLITVCVYMLAHT